MEEDKVSHYMQVPFFLSKLHMLLLKPPVTVRPFHVDSQ